MRNICIAAMLCLGLATHAATPIEKLADRIDEKKKKK